MDILGKKYTALPKGMIIDAILREVYSDSKENVYPTAVVGELPENLKKFAAKQRKKKG